MIESGESSVIPTSCENEPCSHAPGTPGCALDREDLWAEANPALGRRITIEAMRFFRRSLPAAEFAREFLGWWDDSELAGAPAIDPARWSSLVGVTPPQGRDVVFGLDVAPDHSSATVAAAWSTPDGTWLQLADCRPGVEWVAGRCADLLGNWGGRLLGEQTGTAAFLLPLITAAPVSRRLFVDSCSTFDAAVTARTLRHGNQPELNAAVTAARWSSSGESGQRVLARKDPRVSPLVATALAVHGLATAPVRGGWMVSLP